MSNTETQQEIVPVFLYDYSIEPLDRGKEELAFQKELTFKELPGQRRRGRTTISEQSPNPIVSYDTITDNYRVHASALVSRAEVYRQSLGGAGNSTGEESWLVQGGIQIYRGREPLQRIMNVELIRAGQILYAIKYKSTPIEKLENSVLERALFPAGIQKEQRIRDILKGYEIQETASERRARELLRSLLVEIRNP